MTGGLLNWKIKTCGFGLVRKCSLEVINLK
jgi:hypothetical protein